MLNFFTSEYWKYFTILPESGCRSRGLLNDVGLTSFPSGCLVGLLRLHRRWIPAVNTSYGPDESNRGNNKGFTRRRTHQKGIASFGSSLNLPLINKSVVLQGKTLLFFLLKGPVLILQCIELVKGKTTAL